MSNKSALISIETYQEWKTKFDSVLLDASIPPIGTAPENIIKETIPGSLFFDIEKSFSNPDSGLPHTLIKPDDFEQKVQALGINQNTLIIAFDAYGIYSSPRAWWMFKIMGHENVFVLNGGLTAWKAAGFKTELTFAQAKARGNFQANFKADRIVTKEKIAAQLADPIYTIIDARSSARFNAQVDEPRKGLRKGHIPGSSNIPFAECIESGHLKSTDALSQIVKINSTETNVFTCGSGLTACIPLLAFYELGYRNLSLYDGSWTEWGADQTLPIEPL